MFYLFIFLFLITGHIYNLIIFTSFIFVHELGHTLTAYLFKFKIDKICIYPYGGISKFTMIINTYNYQELLVLISGPLLQFIFFILTKDLINIKYIDTYIFYNYFILIFNMLPIYPLDGGKLINILFSYIFPFKYSYIITFIISFIGIGILIGLSIINKSLLYLIIIIFIFIKLNDENKNLNNIYNKFLLERYLYNFNFKKYICINNINKLKKDKYHYINNIDEKVYLNRYFKQT